MKQDYEIYDPSIKTLNKNKNSKYTDKLKIYSCKLGFRTKISQIKKELNLQNENKNQDVFLYFKLDCAQICFNKSLYSSDNASLNNNNKFFNAKSFSIDFLYNSKVYQIEFELQSIYKISKSKRYLHILEFFFNKDFKIFNRDLYENMNFETNSPFFDILENQILRNWIQHPVLRLEFLEKDNIKDPVDEFYNPGVKSILNFISEYENKNWKFNNYNRNIINTKHNLKKSNIFYTDFIFYGKFMREINDSNIKTILENYEKDILDKMNFLTVDKRFAIFIILSSGNLENPIDLDEFLLGSMTNFLSDIQNNDLLYNSNKNNKKNLYNNLITDELIFEENLFENENLFDKKVNLTNLDIKAFDRITEFFKYFDLSRKRTKFKNNETFFNFLFQQISNFNRKVISKKIKKIIITPNNFIFKYDWLHYTNRILDTNRDKEEHFLIVNFADRNLDKDFYSFMQKSKLIDYFEDILKKGIKLGLEIKYDFLCYSNSQLKSHSIWMIYETVNFNMKNIFEKQGNFEKIDNIASNASRRGLCLTSAKYYGKILPENIKEIPDFEIIRDESREYVSYISKFDSLGILKSYKGKFDSLGILKRNSLEKNNNEFSNIRYNFTDGVGQISISLAKKICKKLFNCDFASAFQIRIGGYKGVLAVHPELVGDKINLRPSMKKFESESTDLYVIRISSKSPGYLNRQIIYLLSELGVKNKIFEDMLETEINNIKNSLSSNFFNNDGRELKIPNEISKIIGLFEKINPKNEEIESNSFFEYINKKTQMDKQIILKENPFFKGIYNTIFINKLIKLKDKCKLYDEYSGKFIGIIDELGLLKENECFIQVSTGNVNYIDQANKGSIVSEIKLGAITITKNPCGYLEDVQVLYGVENEILKKFCFDVIVFPRTSKRPIQQLISSGDLDGDIYYVSWNSKLTPTDIILNNKKIDSLNYVEMDLKKKGKIIDETNFTKDIITDKNKDIEIKNAKNDYFTVDGDNLSNNNHKETKEEKKCFNIYNEHSNLKQNEEIFDLKTALKSFKENKRNNKIENEIETKYNLYKQENIEQENFYLNNKINNNEKIDLKKINNIDNINSHDDNKNKYYDINADYSSISQEQIKKEEVKKNNSKKNIDITNTSFEDINKSEISFIKKNEKTSKFIDINESYIDIKSRNDDYSFDYNNYFATQNTCIIENVKRNINEIPKNIINDNLKFNNTIDLNFNFNGDNNKLLNNIKNKNIIDKCNDKIYSKYIINQESLFNENEIRLEDLKNNKYRESLIKFFCLYLKNDNLGTICNSLMATSDRLGPQDEETLILCIYQRKSVTFFKTGKTNLIKDFKKITSYPDFMERGNYYSNQNNNYESKRVLGILYRKVKDLYEAEKKNLQENDLAISIPNKYLVENLILFYGFEFFTKISWNFYEDYFYELNDYLFKHKLEREFEFISTIRSPIFDYYSKKQIENYDSKIEMEKDFEKFVQKYKKEFLLNTLKILFLLLQENSFKLHLLENSFEIFMKQIIDQDSWNRFNNKISKFDFKQFEGRFNKIINEKCKAEEFRKAKKCKNDLEEQENNEFKEINYYTLNSSDLELIIEKYYLEILDINTKIHKQSSLDNLKKFYLKFKKAFLTSIYYCSYFCFFENCIYSNEYILNENLFNISNKFLSEKFKEIEIHEDINNANYTDKKKNNEYILKNRNFFSMPWIIDTKLLLEIKFT